MSDIFYELFLFFIIHSNNDGNCVDNIVISVTIIVLYVCMCVYFQKLNILSGNHMYIVKI